MGYYRWGCNKIETTEQAHVNLIGMKIMTSEQLSLTCDTYWVLKNMYFLHPENSGSPVRPLLLTLSKQQDSCWIFQVSLRFLSTVVFALHVTYIELHTSLFLGFRGQCPSNLLP